MTGQADRTNDTSGPGGGPGPGGPGDFGGPGAGGGSYGAGGSGGAGGPAGFGSVGDSGGTGRVARWRAAFDKGRAVASRYALLPLRVFLGVTFVYAGLDKLTDPGFFADTGSGSIGETMRGVRDSSAIPALVDLALRNPTGFGYAIAFGEIAVGIGTLLGFFARLAALGGALISLSLWLTVSWQVNPYYLGNDLAYLMSWLPLVLAGASVLSVDRFLAERRRIR
ncbi:DoxX family protein [Streptomyces wedmorensis]|uniref:DoxX family protein n=1 Tax=Streptomyces wedmorensis TaxID=43759 RepID=UPI003F4D1196